MLWLLFPYIWSSVVIVKINAKMTEGLAGVALAYWAGTGFDSRLCQFFPIRCCFQVIFALDVFMCKFSDDTNFTWSISGKEIFCHFYVAWYKVFNALTPVCTWPPYRHAQSLLLQVFDHLSISILSAIQCAYYSLLSLDNISVFRTYSLAYTRCNGAEN